MLPTEMAKALFDAFVSGDDEAVRSLCAPELEAIQNHAPPMTLDVLLEFSAAVRRLMPDYHYADVRRFAISGGFVEEHSVRGTLPDGDVLTLAACVIGEIDGGRITQLREYVDSAAAARLVRAMADARPQA